MTEGITDDDLIAHAELGERAREFLGSELGRLMVGFADQELNDALHALGDVEPTDTDSIRKLQNKVTVARWFAQWLAEIVSKGENAISIYKHQKETS